MKYLFLLVLMISFQFFSCKNQSDQRSGLQKKNCVDAIIQKDKELGLIRNLACKDQSLSQTIHDYIGAVEKLNFGDCPEKFSLAFQAHLQAWKAIIPLTDEYPDLRGEMHQLFNIIGDGQNGAAFQDKVGDIWSTWSDVEKAMK